MPLDQTALKRAVEDVMEKLPPSTGRGYSNIFITLDGAQAEVGHRISQGWNVGAFGSVDWSGKRSAGVMLKGKW